MFYDSFGLINSRPDEVNCENALLFTVEHYFMTKSRKDYDNLVKAIEICRVNEQVYLQNPSYREHGAVIEADNYMSHDQSTAIIMFSWYNGLKYHTELWNEMKRQWFFYDNINTPKGIFDNLKTRRPIHPRDIILYGSLCGSIICKLLLPILWIIMLVTALKKKKVRPHGTFPALDGKLLNYIRISAQKDTSFMWNLQWKLHTWLMNRNWNGWKAIFALYFPYSNHPNVVDFEG